MHKSYQSVLPCSNKLLQKKWDSQYYEEHRAKVRDVKPMVDTKPPRTYMHLHLKLKKLQLEEERLATIERDNRILLEKMSYIMRTRGRIDNRNDYEARSLNREKRQRELLRVTSENQEILKRIMQRQPEYDHVKWEQDWESNVQYMDSISAYPRDWWKMGKESTMDANESEKQKKKKKAKQEERSENNDDEEEEENTYDQQQEDTDEKDEEKETEEQEGQY